MVITNQYQVTASVLLGYGDGSFASQISYSTGSSPIYVVVGDFNNDNRLDFVVLNEEDDNIGVFLGYVTISFFDQITFTTGSNSQPQALISGYVNSDTQLDIIVANWGINNVGVFLGYGNGSFTNQITYSTGSFPSSIGVGDFNNDKRLDIVVANFGSNNVGILLGYGNGSFANQTTYLTGSAPGFVAVDDFNGDSYADILVTIPDMNKIGIFLGLGKGVFGDLVLFSMSYGSSPSSVAVGHFNNDNKLDLAVIKEGTDSLTILLQTC
jgi:hypothetical protein